MKSTLAVSIVFVSCFTSLALASGPQCAASSDAIPLCTVLADAAKYDGKEIIIRGLYRMVLHGSILTSPACAHTYVNMRRTSDYKADKRASQIMRSLTKDHQFQLIDVVYKGVFRAAEQGQCFGQNCLLYEIEARQLLCAEKPQPETSATTTTWSHEAGHAQPSEK